MFKFDTQRERRAFIERFREKTDDLKGIGINTRIGSEAITRKNIIYRFYFFYLPRPLCKLILNLIYFQGIMEFLV